MFPLCSDYLLKRCVCFSHSHIWAPLQPWLLHFLQPQPLPPWPSAGSQALSHPSPAARWYLMKGEVNEGEVKMKEGEHFVPCMERSQIRLLIFFLTSTLSICTPQGSVASSSADWNNRQWLKNIVLQTLWKKTLQWLQKVIVIIQWTTCISRAIDSRSDRMSPKFLVPSTFLIIKSR